MYINNLKGKYVQHLLSVDDMSEDFILEIWTNALKNKENTDKSYEIKDKNLDVEISEFEDGKLRETLISLGNKILGKQIIPIREDKDE